MKLFNMYLLFYLLKHKINASGTCPIYARITIDGERYQFSTGLRIKPKNWNQKKCRSNNKLLNTEIESFEIEIKQISSALRIKNKLNIKNIRECMAPKTKTNTISLSQILDNYRMTKIQEKINAYSDRFYKNILVYIEMNNIQKLEQLNNDFVNHFFDWLKTDREITNGKYLQKHFSYLNQSLELACNMQQIKFNPLRKTKKPKYPKLEKQVVLTDKEVQKIIDLKPTYLRHKRCRFLFLFSCFTGLGYSDVQNFKIEQIQYINSCRVITGRRQKNGKKYTTDCPNIIMQLLKQFDNNIPKLSNQKYNEYIKEIAVLVGIDKRITTHVARRTFGQLMLNKGANIESVSHMMGHSDIQVTQRHYASAGTSLVINQLKLLKTA